MAEPVRPTLGGKAAVDAPAPAPVSMTRTRSSLGPSVAATADEKAQALEVARARDRLEKAEQQRVQREAVDAAVMGFVDAIRIRLIDLVEVEVPPGLTDGQRLDMAERIHAAVWKLLELQKLAAVLAERRLVAPTDADFSTFEEGYERQVRVVRLALADLVVSGYGRWLTDEPRGGG